MAAVIDAGYHLHKEIGPGLLESVYEAVLAARLERLGLKVVRQMPVHIKIDDMDFANAYRVDLFVNDWLVVELKALENLSGVHIRQTQTYVKLLKSTHGASPKFRLCNVSAWCTARLQQRIMQALPPSSFLPSSF